MYSSSHTVFCLRGIRRSSAGLRYSFRPFPLPPPRLRYAWHYLIANHGTHRAATSAFFSAYPSRAKRCRVRASALRSVPFRYAPSQTPCALPHCLWRATDLPANINRSRPPKRPGRSDSAHERARFAKAKSGRALLLKNTQPSNNDISLLQPLMLRFCAAGI